MFILDKLRRIKKSLSAHQPLIEIFIYKHSLLNNLHRYQNNYPGLKFSPVLKANAYGHGLKPVLTALKDETLPFVSVDSYFEAIIVKRFAPDLRALVIGYSRLESIVKADFLKTAFAIISFDQLKEIAAKLKTKKCFHLKLDTGMHRQGILSEQYPDVLKLMGSNRNIILEGVCSHLADPDNGVETQKQIENWNSAVKFFKKEFPKIEYTHLSATGGVKYSPKIDANLVRLGIGFYGIDQNQADLPPHQKVEGTGLKTNGAYPQKERAKAISVDSWRGGLKLGLEMHSIITGVKTIGPGEKVGYGLAFEAKKPMTIATVPVGYFEGVDRRLSNQGAFKVGQEFCPLIGRLSMDISTIDVTENKKAVFGGEVIIISANPNDINSVQNIARICETLPYEILVHIPEHLKRSLI